jgi:hypothetical protein
MGVERAPPVATGRKTRRAENGSKRPTTVAVGCHRLPIAAHGERGRPRGFESLPFRLTEKPLNQAVPTTRLVLRQRSDGFEQNLA